MDPELRQYEHYREVFRITAWRDGCVYATESLGCRWVSGDVIADNIPGDTDLMYVAANDEFANTHMTVRSPR